MKRAQGLLFGDYLKSLSPDAIFEHLVEENRRGRRIVSTGLVDEIAHGFTAQSALAKRVEGLSAEGRRACAMAYLLGRSGLVAHGLNMVYGELVRSFLVYAARDASDARHLIGFDDLAGPLRPMLAPSLVRRVERGSVQAPPDTVRHRALGDFVVVAVEALGGRLRKNRNGELNKGCSAALGKLLSVRGGRKQAHPVCGVSEAVSLLLAYGVDRGVLTDLREGYGTNNARIAAWLERPVEWLYDDFVGFVVQHTGGWRIAYLEEMQAAAGEDWLSTEAFLPTCMQPAATALRCLDYACVVEAVETDGAMAWRLRPPASGTEGPREGVTVMPDFSVIIARETSPALLYAFSWLGVLSSFDQVYKGKVERDAVNDALSRGVGSAELIGLLRRWRAPDNVVATVEEWIRGYSRLCVRHGDLVVSHDAKVTKQLLSYEPIRAMADPLEADAVFVIREGKRDAVWRALSAMGFDPRSAGTPEETSVSGEELAFPEEEPLEPLFELEAPSEDEIVHIKHGKYSADLKVLDVNEMLHVIDYAILMGYVLRFEYAGSPHVRRGQYAVKPAAVEKGDNLCLEGVVTATRRKKKFFVRKIEKIGVVTE